MNRQCPVPKYQRPLSEYNDLKNSFTFSWTAKESFPFTKTLVIVLVCLVIFSSVIVTNSHEWQKHKITSFLEVIISAIGICNIWILRLYLAWKYIYNRLMNATITYEESGWYDGQTWIKTNMVLQQDRLVGTYEVLPLINRLRLIILVFTVSILILGRIYIALNKSFIY